MEDLIDQQLIDDIELSIEFGQRFMLYEKEILQMKLLHWDRNDKYDQYFLKDKSVILEIISNLEQGKPMGDLKVYKRMMTVVGGDFFKNQFKNLKKHLEKE